ncbi:YetF domain-containing protein [Sorangium sp. So ce134]
METVARVALVYVFLAVALRVLGKRELSSMSPFELVTLMLIPEIVSQALVREASLANALAGVSTLLVLVFLTSVLTHLSPRASKVIDGTPTVLVARGRILEDACNRERIQPDEIVSEMHKSGLAHLSQVRWAILEADGDLTIVPEQGQALPVARARPRDVDA